MPERKMREIHANTSQTMSMFRVSPWVAYEPTVEQHQPSGSNQMDGDMDLDAPQISTLREEVTPPPQPKTSSNQRRNKPTNKARAADFPIWTRPNWLQPPLTDEEYDEPEEEEDQLIDDDDDVAKPNPATTLCSADTTPKRKPSKRKPRKTDKRPVEEEKKPRERVINRPPELNLLPTTSLFEVPPPEVPEDMGHADIGQVGLSGGLPEPVVPKLPSAKMAAPRKVPGTPRVRTKSHPKAKIAVPVLPDDIGVLSEGYTGTAASSPVTAHLEPNSPEPENLAALTPLPLTEDTNLENIPLPVYPLPTKPFPVQPPLKISTGFAPIVPLDKSGKKVRHWRTANREIRGIAGGRWFARTWVGEKDSELSLAIASASQAKGIEDKHLGAGGPVALPKLSGVSISAPSSGRGPSKSRAKPTSSLAASTAPSRAGSALPDLPMSSATRAPTKMRTIQLPPDLDDIDITPPLAS